MTNLELIFWWSISLYVCASILGGIWMFQLFVRAELLPFTGFKCVDDVTLMIRRILEGFGMSLLASFLWPVFLHEFGWEENLKPYLDKKFFKRGGREET